MKIPTQPVSSGVNFCPVCGTMLRPVALALEFQAVSVSGHAHTLAAPAVAPSAGTRAAITPELVAQVRAWRDAGLSPSQIEKTHGVPRAQCANVLYSKKWKSFVLPAPASFADAPPAAAPGPASATEAPRSPAKAGRGRATKS